LVLPPRTCDDFIDTRSEAHAPDPQVVRRHRIRFDEMAGAHLSRIEIQLFGNLVEVHLQRIARLRRSVSALGATWWLVGENAYALEFVARHFISHRLQCPGVERARNAIAS